MMNPPASPLAIQKRYELITRALRLNILSGKLAQGFRAARGADRRTHAVEPGAGTDGVEVLEDENLVHRFSGRGFLVGPAGLDAEPLRRDIRELDLQISVEIDEALQSRGTWELVYDRVGRASCLLPDLR